MTDLPFPSSAPITLRCPKCHAEMVMYERTGIVIDQCRECRGIFLDRGEIEHLLDAEARAFASSLAAPPVPVVPGEARGGRHWDDDDDDDDDDNRRREWRGRDDLRNRYDRPRRRAFLGELLDSLGD